MRGKEHDGISLGNHVQYKGKKKKRVNGQEWVIHIVLNTLKKSLYFFSFAHPFFGLQKELWNLVEPGKSVGRAEERNNDTHVDICQIWPS